ncbi:hypothetical protein U1Q18_000360, partial [Sarracenia purpurea var. burkii]
MARRPAKSSSGREQVRGGRRDRGRRGAEVPDSYSVVPRPAAEATITAGMSSPREAPAAVEVPVAREVAAPVVAPVAWATHVAAE